MNSLIFAALITLTMPSFYVDGNPLPDKKLTAILYRVGETEPVNALVAYPGERVEIETELDFASWYLIAWNIGTLTPSENSEIVTKTRPVVDCPGCHL